MARIFRQRVNWTGFVGAPGYSVFHGLAFEADPTNEATAFQTAVNTFMVNISNNLPNNVDVTTDPEVEVLEDSTGTLLEVVNLPAQATISGSGGLNYSAPTGAVVNWGTGMIRNGRRIRGRTFLVPLASAAYEADGSLVAAVRDDITVAAMGLMNAAGTQLGIYGRPTILGNDGVTGRVTSANCPDMAAVLRSRRD